MKMVTKWDIPLALIAGVFFGLGLLCIYGGYWWFATYILPFYGLTLYEVLEMPVLDIVFGIMTFWMTPGLTIAGLGIILGLVKALLE